MFPFVWERGTQVHWKVPLINHHCSLSPSLMLNIELPSDPLIPFLRIYPRELKIHAYTRTSMLMLINNQKVEMSQLSIN